MDIVPYVARALGIDEGQARGAVGLLLKLAKSHLDGSIFGTVLGAIPGGEAMLEEAPDFSGGLAGMAANVLGDFGGVGKAAAGAAEASAGMEKLGLDASQFGPLLGAVQGWLGENGSVEAARAFDDVAP